MAANEAKDEPIKLSDEMDKTFPETMTNFETQSGEMTMGPNSARQVIVSKGRGGIAAAIQEGDFFGIQEIKTHRAANTLDKAR
jgi:hypothetical protein